MHPSALIGERIFGEYTIVDHLGDGATGAVYLARQDSLNKEIAVKVLQAKAAEDDETVERFKREALAISLLSHPNIIRVLIFGRTDSGLLYLAMEYVEGESLQDLINSPEAIDELRVIKIFKQLCSALAEAHEMGIIHRDLKPENILLTEYRGTQDFVKVLDFGLAKIGGGALDPSQRQLTKAGIVYGTPAYLSPEQAQASDLDHRCDIYALGCILYHFMTGELPFMGDSAVHILSAHVHDEPVPPSKVAPGRVAPSMEEIILKAMSKKREDRYGDATEMLHALEAREREIQGGSKQSEEAPSKSRFLANRLWLINGIIIGATGMFAMVVLTVLVFWWMK